MHIRHCSGHTLAIRSRLEKGKLGHGPFVHSWSVALEMSMLKALLRGTQAAGLIIVIAASVGVAFAASANCKKTVYKDLTNGKQYDMTNGGSGGCPPVTCDDSTACREMNWSDPVSGNTYLVCICFDYFPQCVKGFRQTNPDGSGEGKCLKWTCPNPCDEDWNVTQDPEVAQMDCICQ